jgi:hypothetical protein
MNYTAKLEISIDSLTPIIYAHVVRTHCDLIKKIVLIDPSNMPTKKLEVIECEIVELFEKALDSASLGHDERIPLKEITSIID